MARRLIHYSKTPLKEVRSVAQRDGPGSKPRGLWISAEGEDDWPSWCKAEDFALDSLAHATEISLTGDILYIDSVAGIDAFHREYSAPLSSFFTSIDWKRVATDYQGIVISPYQWRRRLDGVAHEWYYGWDCASGCVWDAAAICSFCPIDAAES